MSVVRKRRIVQPPGSRARERIAMRAARRAGLDDAEAVVFRD